MIKNYNRFKIKFVWQSLETLKYYLFDGWDIFVSRIFVSLYTTTNIIILGIFTNNTIVGYYTIAEKIINVVAGLFIPANQTIYPYMARIYTENKKNFFNFIIKISYLFLLISLVLFMMLSIFSTKIVILVSNTSIVSIENIYMILVFTIITNPFGPLFTQALIIQKLNREFKKIVRYTFFFNILTAPILIYLYEAQGLAFIVVLSQVLVIGLCLKEILKVRSLVYV